MCGDRYGGSSVGTGGKKVRRRVPTIAQRRAANVRERRRMFNLNEAFDKLRRKVGHLILQLFFFTYILDFCLPGENILTSFLLM